MTASKQLTLRARTLAGVLEPLTGQVYFARECHEAYEALGFAGSPTKGGPVQMPDGPAYFTSRGSVMGHVPGELVAAAFGVFNPAAVIPAVTYGWTLTDAKTICAARTKGATAQLVRILGEEPEGLKRATELLTRMTDTLRPEGKSLYAGVRSQGAPGDPMGDFWWTGDMLREYRGDAHINAWTSAGCDATEIGLLTELHMGIPMRTYVRSRAWTNEELDAAQDRLRSRGLIDGDSFTEEGRSFREAIEDATDIQMERAIDALGDDADELFTLLAPWGAQVREAGGYIQNVVDLTGSRRA